jgi:hypothetical protein
MCAKGARMHAEVLTTFKVGDEQWRLVAIWRFEDEEQWGGCSYTRREIAVKKGLSGPDTLRVILHELVHAFLPNWKEARVDAMSDEVTTALLTCGVLSQKFSGGRRKETPSALPSSASGARRRRS